VFFFINIAQFHSSSCTLDFEEAHVLLAHLLVLHVSCKIIRVACSCMLNKIKRLQNGLAFIGKAPSGFMLRNFCAFMLLKLDVHVHLTCAKFDYHDLIIFKKGAVVKIHIIYIQTLFPC